MTFDNLQDDWNDDIAEDLKPDLKELEEITVASRDWTVETIVNQIKKGNIDLDPKFQRRNAWNDVRRSRLIESLIIGMPVPEIVLAEDPTRKGSFIVIDGKQRLTSVIGFIEPNNNDYKYWDVALLKELKTRSDLNGQSFEGLLNKPKFEEDSRRLINAGIRCTVITNYKSSDVLYDIFYRLNTGSVPLSTQELRQVLNKGKFADYLIDITGDIQPLHQVMELEKPDNRLRDGELILRVFSVTIFGDDYKSNLKKFLDDSMGKINNNWDEYKPTVEKLYENFNHAIEMLGDVMGTENVGRKFTKNKWEGKFNKVLFEVEVFYFMHLNKRKVKDKEKRDFLTAFQNLSSNDNEFRRSIELSTKDIGQYDIRFRKFMAILNKSFKTKITKIPVSPKP